MSEVNPDLAVDLSERSVDLSQEAIKQRDRERRLLAAEKWMRTMKRTFKGISGGRSREGYALIAIKKFKLREDA